MLRKPPKNPSWRISASLGLLVALTAGPARAQAPAFADSVAHVPVPLVFDGTGTSVWGPVPATADSVAFRPEDPGLSLWEYPVAGLWWLVKLPFALLNAGMKAVVNWWGEIPFSDTIALMLSRHPEFGVRPAAEWTPSGGFEYALDFYEHRLLGGKLHAHYLHGASVRGNLVNAVATRAYLSDQTWLDLICSYDRRGAERYYGPGSESRRADESYFTGRNVWAGGALVQHLDHDLSIEGRVYYSDLSNAGPRKTDDRPSVDEVFAGDLPYGWDQSSTGMSYELEVGHDATGSSGRAVQGGLRRASVSYFHPTSGPGHDHVQYRLGLEQFIGGHGPSGRRLALKALWSWIDSGGNPVHFQRLLTNDVGDSFRGFHDFRFRDRGIIGLTTEYRYPVWDYAQIAGALGADGYVFYEAGQVFSDHQLIRMKSLTHSIGMGIRLVRVDDFMALAEIAGSREDLIARVSVSQVFQRAKGGMYHGRIPVPAR